MKNQLLDTNIVIVLIRSNDMKAMLSFLFPHEEHLYLSVVTVAELRTFARINQWGKSKIAKLDYILSQVYIVEVTDFLIETYVEIDSFSQCRNPNFATYNFATPRNMGKNDLWIASTAALLNLTLVTTDLDFTHLHDIF